MNQLVLLLVLCAANVARSNRIVVLQGDDDGVDLEDLYEDRPYSFAWEASRHYNGAPDREHREQRGQDGVTRGVYRFVDPSRQVKEVIYTADDNGFHVENPQEPEYTRAQERERQRHANLFQSIAADHAAVAEERGHEPEVYVPQDYPSRDLIPGEDIPLEAPVVERARQKHAELFAKIAAQHQRIAEERSTDPTQEETGEPFQYQYETSAQDVQVSGGFPVGQFNPEVRVTQPGDDHPDFQGYGVSLGPQGVVISEDEALDLIQEQSDRHLDQFHRESDLHESLVLNVDSGNANRARGFNGGSHSHVNSQSFSRNNGQNGQSQGHRNVQNNHQGGHNSNGQHKNHNNFNRKSNNNLNGRNQNNGNHQNNNHQGQSFSNHQNNFKSNNQNRVHSQAKPKNHNLNRSAGNSRNHQASSFSASASNRQSHSSSSLNNNHNSGHQKNQNKFNTNRNNFSQSNNRNSFSGQQNNRHNSQHSRNNNNQFTNSNGHNRNNRNKNTPSFHESIAEHQQQAALIEQQREEHIRQFNKIADEHNRFPPSARQGNNRW